jgi:hypothetical protein
MRNPIRPGWLLLALPLFIIVVACSCGSGLIPALSTPTETPTPAPTETPLPTSTPTSPPELTATPEQTAATLIVQNDGVAEICDLFVSPVTKDTWDEADQYLATGATIPPGETFTVEVPPGQYDLLAEGCANQTLGEDYGVELAAGGEMTWTVGADNAPSGGGGGGDPGRQLTVTNDSSYTICAVYVAAPEDTFWEMSEIDEEIPPGDYVWIYPITPGIHHIRAEACDGETAWEQKDVDLMADYEWVLQDTDGFVEEYGPSLIVNNQTGVDVCQIYVEKSANPTAWTSNVIPNQYIPSGDTYTLLDLTEGASYSLRVEACDTDDSWEELGIVMDEDKEWIVQ